MSESPHATTLGKGKPAWLRTRLAQGGSCGSIKKILEGSCLNTVCVEAMCPNIGECWQKGHATVMILGKDCSRSCAFCNVSSIPPSACDTNEPERVAEAVAKLNLRNIVLTSVTRDDLPDNGSAVWAQTVKLVKQKMPGRIVEVLIPDFAGSEKDLETVLKEEPHVVGHNLETVERLYAKARPQADYQRSLTILKRSHEKGFITKTGIMVGLGETDDEIIKLMKDAANTGVNILTIGQYLQPSRKHLPVDRYVAPEDFEKLARIGEKSGISVVISSPLVRSSYYSEKQERFAKETLAKKGIIL